MKDLAIMEILSAKIDRKKTRFESGWPVTEKLNGSYTSRIQLICPFYFNSLFTLVSINL
jgi:hypothetical protein